MSSIDSIPSDLSEPETQSQLAWELMWGDPLRYDNVWLDRCSECPRLPIKVDLLNNPFKAVSSENSFILWAFCTATVLLPQIAQTFVSLAVQPDCDGGQER